MKRNYSLKKALSGACAFVFFAMSALNGSNLIDVSARNLYYAPVDELNCSTCPSTGNIRSLVVVVDFKDAKYNDNRLSDEELKNDLYGDGVEANTPFDSVSGFYNRASYGELSVSGDVYSYTAKKNIADYEDSVNGFEPLVTEVINALNKKIDFTKYDSDKDGYVDSLIFSIAAGSSTDFWYGCTATWWSMHEPKMDGEAINQYIINDEQPYYDTLTRYTSVVCHEMGHTMGLPDYYKYNVTDNWEGLNGTAGKELMDDADGEFGAFSKLMLGYVKKNNAKILTADGIKASDKEISITLKNDEKSPSVMIIKRKTGSSSRFSEYFIAEYVSGNDGTGLRIYHIDSKLINQYGDGSTFKYEGFSSYYDTTGNGIRVIRLVNDGNGFFKKGDKINAKTSGFGWYDGNGSETVDPGFTIKVKSISEDKCVLTLKAD
jgi:M6 family metalloprotease-like protein